MTPSPLSCRWPGVIALVTLALTAGCVGKVSRAFFLPDQMPASLPYMTERTFVNVLPERLEPWQVEFSMYSFWRESDKDRINLHDYSIVIAFVLPGGDPAPRTSFTRPGDGLDLIVRVPELSVRFLSEQSPRLLTPLPSSDDPRRVTFFTAAAPIHDDSVAVSFVAEVVDLSGLVVRSREFGFTLSRLEERTNAWFTSH